MLDLQKASETAGDEILIDKLKAIGFRRLALRRVHVHISERSMKVMDVKGLGPHILTLYK